MVTKRPSPTTRRSGPERRDEIAAAALRLIGEQGISHLTMSTLAAAVGVTSGALFRHFRSREEILEAAVEQAVARLDTTFPDAALPPMERLFGLARARVAAVRGHPGIAWLLLSEHATHDLPRDAVWKLEGLVRRSKRFLVEAIADGVRGGEIRADIPSDALLVPVVGTIHMLIRAPGPHRAAYETKERPEPVLDALALLLAPPGAPGRNPT